MYKLLLSHGTNVALLRTATCFLDTGAGINHAKQPHFPPNRPTESNWKTFSILHSISGTVPSENNNSSLPPSE